MKFLKRQLCNFSNTLYRIRVTLLCVHTQALLQMYSLIPSEQTLRRYGNNTTQPSCHLGRQGWEEKVPKDVLTRDL